MAPEFAASGRGGPNAVNSCHSALTGGTSQRFFSMSLNIANSGKPAGLVADLHDLGRISNRLDRQSAHQHRRKPLEALEKGPRQNLFKSSSIRKVDKFLGNVLQRSRLGDFRQILDLSQEVGRLINGLIRSLSAPATVSH